MKIRINKITMLLLSVFAVIVLRCNTDAYAATAAPYPVIINNNATVTTSTRVRLALTSGAAVAMRLGNTLAEMNTASWEPCVTSKIWRLSAGTGMKTVYVQFKDAAGVTTTTNIVASIKLNDLPKAVIVGKNVAGQLLVGRYDGTTLNTSAWASGTDQDLSHWRMVCAADVTGDGVDDLVGLKSDGSLAVWSSSRSGFTFSTGGTIGTLALKELQAADYDADGKIDIAGRTDAGAIYVLRSSGSGFITKQWGAWPVPVTDMQAGDVNGDGMGDLVARDVNNNIYVARSAGTGFFVDKKAWGAWPKGVSSIQPADVNGDGMMDLVGYDAASGSLYAALSDGAKFTVQNWGTLGGPVNGPIYDLQAADINGDGKADMVARCFNGDWYVARSDGSKFNTEYLGGWSCVDWHDVQVADINGDGVSDIIGRNDDNEWYALLSDGSLFKTVYLGGWAAGCWMNVIAANFSDQSYTAVPAFSRKASVPDTTPPTGNISINNGASTTALASVTLTIDGSDTQTGVARMRVANASASLVTALWEPFAATKAWTVAAGLGAKNVYVQLQDGAGNISTTSISDSVEVVPPAAPKITALAVDPAAVKTINLSWSWNQTLPAAITAASGTFLVERRVLGTTAWGQIGSAAKLSILTYKDAANLNFSTSYEYRVTAKIPGWNNSTPSDPSVVTIGAAAPTNLAVASKVYNKVTLSWSYPTGGTNTTLIVERKTGTVGTYAAVKTGVAAAPATGFIDDDAALRGSTQYFYRIRAYNSVLKAYSAYSNEISAVTSVTPPANVTATRVGNAASISWQWNGATGENIYGFSIERRSIINNVISAWTEIKFVQYTSGTDLSFDDGNLPSGTYDYRIRTKYKISAGDPQTETYSVSVNGQKSVGICPPIPVITLTQVDTGIKISYTMKDAVTGAMTEDYDGIVIWNGSRSYGFIPRAKVPGTQNPIPGTQTFIDPCVVYGTIYTYKAQGHSSLGTSSTYSNQASLAYFGLPKMTYFYGRVTSPTKVTLQWNNPMDPVGQYNNVQVFRDGVLLKTFLTGVSMSAAIIDNLKEGQTYVFKVRGVMIVNGKSLYSDFTDPVTLTPTR